MSDFAKRLLAAGRADVDPDELARKRALLERLEKPCPGVGAEAVKVSKASLVRWLCTGAAVGVGALTLLVVREERSSHPPTESAPSVAEVATVAAAPEPRIPETIAPMPTTPSSPSEPPTVTPDSLPTVVPPARREATHAPPSDLLREANQLRAQSRWAEASKKYEQVLRDRPDSPSVYPATVAMAKLALDHLGDPRGALALYDRAMRMAPDGNLAEEAAWGRARALRALGRRDDERGALRSFLSNHPSSLLAGTAAERLKTLEAR